MEKKSQKLNRGFALTAVLLLVGGLGALGAGTVYLSRILPGDNSKQSTMEQRVVMKVGQEKKILGLVVNPIKIVSDSRCPKDKVCVWAGAVSVETKLTAVGKTETVTLRSAGGGSYKFGNYEISLIEVFPEKGDLPIESSQYLLTFLVSKK